MTGESYQIIAGRTLLAVALSWIFGACLSSDDTGEESSDAGHGPDLPSSCQPGQPEGLTACVEQSRLAADLSFIAAPRPPGSAHWQAVQDLCAQRFEEHGYQVELHAYDTGVNVIGTRTGAARPNEQVLLSAHYDHIEGCAGADDNASGVAGLLEAARVLAMADHDRTLVVACWDEEESGMDGSEAYALRASENGDEIVVSVVYEMIGYSSDEPGSQTAPDGFELLFPELARTLEENEFRGDFIAAVAGDDAADSSSELDRYGDVVGLQVEVIELSAAERESPLLYDFRRSDHSSFWEVGYPAIMLTDTANFRNPNYHCRDGEDTVATLDMDFATRVVQTSVAGVAEILGH